MIEILGSGSRTGQCELFTDDPMKISIIKAILLEAGGEKISMSCYSRNDVGKFTRKLVAEGFIRGTLVDRYHFVSSKITRKGRILLRHLSEIETQNNFL